MLTHSTPVARLFGAIPNANSRTLDERNHSSISRSLIPKYLFLIMEFPRYLYILELKEFFFLEEAFIFTLGTLHNSSSYWSLSNSVLFFLHTSWSSRACFLLSIYTISYEIAVIHFSKKFENCFTHILKEIIHYFYFLWRAALCFTVMQDAQISKINISFVSFKSGDTPGSGCGTWG